MQQKQTAGFTVGQTVVYPGSGIGTIRSHTKQEIEGTTVEMYEIALFTGETVWVPTHRISEQGLRCLSDAATCDKVVDILCAKAGSKSTGAWQRREKERSQKINSGDLQTLASLVRDLYSAESMSHTEHQQYDKAIRLLLEELALVWNKKPDQVERYLKKKTGRAITMATGPDPSPKLEAIPHPLEVGYDAPVKPKT